MRIRGPRLFVLLASAAALAAAFACSSFSPDESAPPPDSGGGDAPVIPADGAPGDGAADGGADACTRILMESFDLGLGVFVVDGLVPAGSSVQVMDGSAVATVVPAGPDAASLAHQAQFSRVTMPAPTGRVDLEFVLSDYGPLPPDWRALTLGCTAQFRNDVTDELAQVRLRINPMGTKLDLETQLDAGPSNPSFLIGSPPIAATRTSFRIRMRVTGAQLGVTATLNDGQPTDTLTGLVPATPEFRLKCGIDDAMSNDASAAPLSTSLEEVSVVVCPD